MVCHLWLESIEMIRMMPLVPFLKLPCSNLVAFQVKFGAELGNRIISALSAHSRPLSIANNKDIFQRANGLSQRFISGGT
jgi:hypothetical protein